MSGASMQNEPLSAEHLRHLERDRWPEFERELWRRRPRRGRFDVHHYGMSSQRWEWALPRCRSWAEVERVLNHHRVDWRRESRELLLDGATVFRCR